MLSLQKQTVILLGEEEIAQVYGGFLQLLSIEEYKCSGRRWRRDEEWETATRPGSGLGQEAKFVKEAHK